MIFLGLRKKTSSEGLCCWEWSWSSKTWLACGLLLGHEAAGLLCDSWQDKTSTMSREINGSHPLKMKRGGGYKSIVLHLKYLRYEFFLFYLVLPIMLLVQMLS